MPLSALHHFIPKPRNFYCKFLPGPLMLNSFDFFSGLVRKKRSGVWRKKSQELLIFVSKSDLIQAGRKGNKKVIDWEIRKEICQCGIFPHKLLTRGTASAVAGSDHPVRSMRWKRHRELAQIYEDPCKMLSTAYIWILVCRQVMFLFPTQAP